MASVFKPKTFTPGNPITSTDLNDLQNNIQSVYDEQTSLTNTSKSITGQIVKIKNAIDNGTVTIKNLTVNTGKAESFKFATNFTTTPTVVVSIAEDLKAKEDVDLAAYAENAVDFKVWVRSSSSDRKEIKINYIAISSEQLP